MSASTANINTINASTIQNVTSLTAQTINSTVNISALQLSASTANINTINVSIIKNVSGSSITDSSQLGYALWVNNVGPLAWPAGISTINYTYTTTTGGTFIVVGQYVLPVGATTGWGAISFNTVNNTINPVFSTYVAQNPTKGVSVSCTAIFNFSGPTKIYLVNQLSAAMNITNYSFQLCRIA